MFRLLNTAGLEVKEMGRAPEGPVMVKTGQDEAQLMVLKYVLE